MKAEFAANGFERWTKGRDLKTREAVRGKYADEKNSAGPFGRIRLWFKMELECLRGTKDGEKSSPSILW